MVSDTVTICECFARDGLQHEPAFVPTARKLEVLEAVVAAGFTRVESSSYSHPARVPAFVDVAEVMRGLPRRDGVSFKNTCPNQRAVQRAIADQDAGYGADELSLLVSASEAHSERNLNASRAAQWDRVAGMTELAAGRFRLVGVVSVALGCPFEGWVDPDVVAADVARFAALGAQIVTVGDTTGLGTPTTVRRLFADLVADHPGLRVVAHFHNTRGTGIANAVAALDAGIREFDSALGGVGGHPSEIHYGQGMTGNVSTEDLVNVFEAMGVSTGLDLDRLAVASATAERVLARRLHSMVARAGYSSLIGRQDLARA